jgi:hypothetical protein
MTLRLTQDETDWLAGVLAAYRDMVVDQLSGEPGGEEEELLRRDRDLATGMLGRLEEGK